MPTSESRHNHAAHGDDNLRDPGDEPRTPASQHTGTQQSDKIAGEGNEEQLLMVVEKSSNSRKRKLASTEEPEEPGELVDEANRLYDKHPLRTIWSLINLSVDLESSMPLANYAISHHCVPV